MGSSYPPPIHHSMPRPRSSEHSSRSVVQTQRTPPLLGLVATTPGGDSDLEDARDTQGGLVYLRGEHKVSLFFSIREPSTLEIYHIDDPEHSITNHHGCCSPPFECCSNDSEQGLEPSQQGVTMTQPGVSLSSGAAFGHQQSNCH